MGYVNSDNIRIFPSSNRTAENHYGENFVTEFNLSSIVNKLLKPNSNGFVISDTYDASSAAEFNIGGYFFKVSTWGDVVSAATAFEEHEDDVNGGTAIELSETIPITDSGEQTVYNPYLYLTCEADSNDYYVRGTMLPAASSVLSYWGYADSVTHLFVVKITFDDVVDKNDFSGTIDGTELKEINPDNFDGDNYIYYILNGSIGTFTITYKANAEAEEKTITIHNEATLYSDTTASSYVSFTTDSSGGIIATITVLDSGSEDESYKRLGGSDSAATPDGNSTSISLQLLTSSGDSYIICPTSKLRLVNFAIDDGEL